MEAREGGSEGEGERGGRGREEGMEAREGGKRGRREGVKERGREVGEGGRKGWRQGREGGLHLPDTSHLPCLLHLPQGPGSHSQYTVLS